MRSTHKKNNTKPKMFKKKKIKIGAKVIHHLVMKENIFKWEYCQGLHDAIT